MLGDPLRVDRPHSLPLPAPSPVSTVNEPRLSSGSGSQRKRSAFSSLSTRLFSPLRLRTTARASSCIRSLRLDDASNDARERTTTLDEDVAAVWLRCGPTVAHPLLKPWLHRGYGVAQVARATP